LPWYRFRREASPGNIYSKWFLKQNQSYRKEALKRLLDIAHCEDDNSPCPEATQKYKEYGRMKEKR
jgi:hypothetical protein